MFCFYYVILSFKDLIIEKQNNQELELIYQALCLEDGFDPDSESDFICFNTFDRGQFIGKYKNTELISDVRFGNPIYSFNNGTRAEIKPTLMLTFPLPPFVLSRNEFIITLDPEKSHLIASAVFLYDSSIEVIDVNDKFVHFKNGIRYPKPATRGS